MSVLREHRAMCSLPTVWSEEQAECAIAADMLSVLECSYQAGNIQLKPLHQAVSLQPKSFLMFSCLSLLCICVIIPCVVKN